MDKFALEILDKVNGFYSSAFSQLVTITLGLIAFIGVFVPILTTYYQSRTMRIERETLEEYFLNRIKNIRNEIEVELEQKILSSLGEFEKDQERKFERVIAGVFHVQANFQIDRKSYKNATKSAISAIESCIKSKDELNLQSGIKLLLERCLPNLSAEQDIYVNELDTALTRVIKEVNSINENGRYQATLHNLEKVRRETITRLSNGESSSN